MSAVTAPYGRLGVAANGNPRVTELLKRSTDGQYQAMLAFQATLAEIRDNGAHHWAASPAQLTLLNQQWLTIVAWEQATTYLDTCVLVDSAFGDGTYRQSDSLCDIAGTLMLKAIDMQTRVGQGKQPGLVQATPYKPPPASPQLLRAAWAAVGAVYTRVAGDLHELKETGTPPRMYRVYKHLTEKFEAAARTYQFLTGQWHTAATPDSQLQLIRQLLPIAPVFFEVGQQLWTPYLTGALYTDIVRNQPQFDKLGLPFDPWLVTDPVQVEARVTDPESCRQLIKFWQDISEPAAVQSIQTQINAALEAEDAVVQQGRTFKIVPWHPYYHANRQVIIGDKTIEPGQSFTLIPQTVDGKRQLVLRVSG